MLFLPPSNLVLQTPPGLHFRSPKSHSREDGPHLHHLRYPLDVCRHGAGLPLLLQIPWLLSGKCHTEISFSELDIIQDNYRNFNDLNSTRPDYLDDTGPVSCHYWRASLGKSSGIFRVLNIEMLSGMLSNGIFWLTCLAFILLPQLLSAFFWIVCMMNNGGFLKEFLCYGLLYPLAVPVTSIYTSAKLLRGGEYQDLNLRGMKLLKMFEHLGQYFHFINLYKLNFWYPGEAAPQLILQIIFITNNGGPTVHRFSVTSGGIFITKMTLL